MSNIWRLASSDFKHLALTWNRAAAPLIAIYVVWSMAADNLVSYLSHPALPGQLDVSELTWILILISVVITLTLVSLWLSFLLIARLADITSETRELRSAQEILRSQGGALINEFLRSATSITWGLALFILPGLVRLIQYLWVPFVVALDSRYQIRHLDALKTSTRFAKRYKGLTTFAWLAILSWDLVATFAVSMLVKDGREGIAYMTHVLTLLLKVYTTLWLALAYRRMMARDLIVET